VAQPNSGLGAARNTGIRLADRRLRQAGVFTPQPWYSCVGSRMVAQNATFDEAYAFAEAEIGIVQKREEIQWLFELVRAARPHVVLEIGLDLGGTFFLWSRAATPDAHLLAIDTRPLGRLGVLRVPFHGRNFIS